MSLRSQLAFVCALARTAAKEEESLVAINEAHQSIGNLLIAVEQEIVRQKAAAEEEEKKKQK